MSALAAWHEAVEQWQHEVAVTPSAYCELYVNEQGLDSTDDETSHHDCEVVECVCVVFGGAHHGDSFELYLSLWWSPSCNQRWVSYFDLRTRPERHARAPISDEETVAVLVQLLRWRRSPRRERPLTATLARVEQLLRLDASALWDHLASSATAAPTSVEPLAVALHRVRRRA